MLFYLPIELRVSWIRAD